MGYLLVNDIVTDVSGVLNYKIIYIDNIEKCCFLIELESTKTNIVNFGLNWLEERISAGDFILNPPNHNTVDIASLSDKQKRIMEDRYEIIESILEISSEPLLYQKKYKARAVRKVSEKFKVGQNTVYKYIRLYLQGGKTKIAMAPNLSQCGGRGKKRLCSSKPGRKSKLIKSNLLPDLGEVANGVAIDEIHYSNMVKTINRTLLSKNNLTIRQAYDQLKFDFYSPMNENIGKKQVLPHYKIPTYNQFYYVVKQLENDNPKRFLEAKEGERSFNLNYRQVLGSSSLEAIQPGFRYEIDATKPFIPLLDSTRKFSIGTATVYYVIDAFSIMIIGFYIGLDNPSKKTACSALLSCIEDKAEIAKRAGVNVSYDDFFVNILPKNLTSDRGELVGELGDRIVSQLGVNVETAASYRGDMKGIVEKAFDVTEKDLLGIIPNYTIKDWKKITRGDIRNDQYPILTINDLRTILLKHIKKHNMSAMKSYPMTKEMIADQINPTPNNIWKWGVKNLGCDGVRPNLDYARYVLTEEKTAAITPRGIEFRGLNYTTEIKDEEINGWFVNARANGRKKIKIHMDERNISTILVKIEGSNEILTFVQTSRTRRQFGDITFFEYQQYTTLKENTQVLNTDMNNQIKIDHMTELESTFDQIKDTAQKAKPISTNRRDHRAEENQKDRITQSVTVLRQNGTDTLNIPSDEVPDIRALRKRSMQRKLDSYRNGEKENKKG